jgi:hypothetical protein
LYYRLPLQQRDLSRRQHLLRGGRLLSFRLLPLRPILLWWTSKRYLLSHLPQQRQLL